jgi:hypothetical protein
MIAIGSEQRQVLGLVITPVTVQMMDDFFGLERPADLLSHH